MYCNSDCTHLIFVRPKVIIAFYIFIKQDSACSTSGVEVYPDAGGMCGLEGFFCFLFGWLDFCHFLFARWGFLLLCVCSSLSVCPFTQGNKNIFLRQLGYLN